MLSSCKVSRRIADANGVISFSMDLAGRVKFEAAKKGIYGLARRFCYQPVKFRTVSCGLTVFRYRSVKFGIVFHT